ncbi:MAG: hypothetical protein EOP50_13590, partial [Sphingobacteriales bacterium]
MAKITNRSRSLIERYNSYVAFLDILGFRDLLNGKNFEERIEEINSVIRHRAEFDGTSHPRLSYISISDTIIIIADKGEGYTLLRKIGQLQNALLKMGVGLRGAISFGPVLTSNHEIIGRNIFGKAYLEAYENEKRAKNPRVIALASATSLLRNDIHKYQRGLKSESVKRAEDVFLLQDSDGEWFVNQFSSDIIGLTAKSRRNNADTLENIASYRR